MAAHPLVEDLLDVVIRRRMRADGTIMVQTKKARWLAKQSVYPTDFIVFASLFSPKQTLSRKLTGGRAVPVSAMRRLPLLNLMCLCSVVRSV